MYYKIKGTGKSYLIETLSMYLRHKYYDNTNIEGWLVVILAPTGLAAYNINGQTIHRFFKLPVMKDGNELFWELSDINLKIIREYLPKIKLFIFGKFYHFNLKNK